MCHSSKIAKVGPGFDDWLEIQINIVVQLTRFFQGWVVLPK